MAKRGVIAIATANSPEFVAPAMGASPTFGTNPIAFAFPKPGGGALTFDMATSAIALFGVLTAKAKGEPPPYRHPSKERPRYSTKDSRSARALVCVLQASRCPRAWPMRLTAWAIPPTRPRRCPVAAVPSPPLVATKAQASPSPVTSHRLASSDI